MIKKKLLPLLLAVFCVNGFVPAYGMQERTVIGGLMGICVVSAVGMGLTARGLMENQGWTKKTKADFCGFMTSLAMYVGGSVVLGKALDNVFKK